MNTNYPVSAYAHAIAAYEAGELQVDTGCYGESDWTDWAYPRKPEYNAEPWEYRRKPLPLSSPSPQPVSEAKVNKKANEKLPDYEVKQQVEGRVYISYHTTARDVANFLWGKDLNTLKVYKAVPLKSLDIKRIEEQLEEV